MTEIKDGSVLPLYRLLNDPLTFKGKPIKFEKISEDSSVYRASTNLSEEERKHNRDYEFIFSLQEAVGTIRSNLVPLQDKHNEDFKGLTDAERVTKQNSLSYQLKRPEPTDTGPNLNQTLNKSVIESSSSRNKSEQGQQTQSKSSGQQQQTQEIKLTGSSRPSQQSRKSDED